MRLSILTLILAFTVSNVDAQWGDNYIKLSENITTETKNITGFDKIDVSEDFEVHISFSDGQETVEIEANENLHDMIQVEKNMNTLKISTKSYSTSSGGWHKKNGAKEKLVAHITINELSEIKANEDVKIVLEDEINEDELTIILAEDSTLKGFLDVQNLIVDLDEDSILNIEGSAQSMDVHANEDSTIKGFDFIVGELRIDLNEDSVAKLTVNGDIDLRAREDSSFYYQGEGNFIRKKLSGDSQVKHR